MPRPSTAVLLLGAVLAPAVPAAAAPERPPIVFVHGFLGGNVDWDPAKKVLASGGMPRDRMFTYGYDYYGDNVANAKGLAKFITGVLKRTKAAKVDIVNHSMGGMVTLWYVKQLGGAKKVRRVASLAGANHGTANASACLRYTTCRQMFPGSAFLGALAAGDETPPPSTYATWFSPCDGVIVPYFSTRLTGASNTPVPCQSHYGILSDLPVLSALRTYLTAGRTAS